jgi:gliding motility-associated-like protein
MRKVQFLVLLMSLCCISTYAQVYTQRLNPTISASTNDICPNDEVELNVQYDLPNNSSLLLNGIDELVNVPNSPGFSFGGATDFSIEFFIKTSSLSPLMAIVSKGDATTPSFGVWMSAGFIIASASDGTTVVPVNGFTNVADGNWHHVAVVFDRDDKITIYTDGAFDNDANMSTVGNVDNIDLLRIGAANVAGSPLQNFNGYIDEVRIWNKALTTGEITSRSTTHINPNTVNNLVGYWDMNDNSAPTIIDCSTSGATGQMVGSASLSLDAPTLIFPFLPRWSTNQTGTTVFVSPTDTAKYKLEIGYCKYASVDSITINVVECEDIDDSGLISSVWVPSAFTPNGDFKNDVFKVQGANITYYEIKIFNRFGNILYHSRDILAGWDGTFEDRYVQDGAYAYIITYRDRKGEEFTKHGTVSIMK